MTIPTDGAEPPALAPDPDDASDQQCHIPNFSGNPQGEVDGLISPTRRQHRLGILPLTTTLSELPQGSKFAVGCGDGHRRKSGNNLEQALRLSGDLEVPTKDVGERRMRLPENTPKTPLSRKLPCFGTWLRAASTNIAEIVGCVGLDLVIIDQEHGPGGVERALGMMRAVAGGNTTAMVRVPSGDPVYLKRIVDAGAQAILIPMVNTAEEARQIVAACLYPPRGRRGNAAAVVRGSRYGLVADHVERAHETLLVVPQVETVEAVANAGEIAAVPGVDMVFIAPSDLSASAGLPGQTGAPEVERLIGQAFAAIRAAGKPVATVPRDGNSWRGGLERSVQWTVMA